MVGKSIISKIIARQKVGDGHGKHYIIKRLPLCAVIMIQNYYNYYVDADYAQVR